MFRSRLIDVVDFLHKYLFDGRVEECVGQEHRYLHVVLATFEHFKHNYIRN